MSGSDVIGTGKLAAVDFTSTSVDEHAFRGAQVGETSLLFAVPWLRKPNPSRGGDLDWGLLE